MAKFKNDKGLTLIELLITISVLAVVSAIALPVINNVVSSSNSNAAVQTQGDVDDFIAKYNAAGETLYANGMFSGYVDTDGDNTIDANELIDTLTIDTGKFSVSATGTSDAVGGTYTAKGVTGGTIALATSSSNGGGNTAVAYTPGNDFPAFTFYGSPAGSAFGGFTLDGTSNAALLANFAYGNDYSVHVVNGSLSADYNVSAPAWATFLSPSMMFSMKWDGSATGVAEALPNFSYTVDSISVTGSTITITVH